MSTNSKMDPETVLKDRITRSEMRALVFGNNEHAQLFFGRVFAADLRSIVSDLTESYNGYRSLSNSVALNQRNATIMLFVHTALNAVLTSTHLFVSGFPVPSGNVMRQFAEASAMAMLCADPTNGVFEKYQADRRHYPVHKSLDLVTTKRVAPSLQNLLGMDRERFQQFARDMRLFDHHSHASALSLSYLVMFTKRGGLVLGSQVDPTKRAARVKCREQTRPMPELTPTTPLQVAISKRAFNALDLERLRARLVAIGSARTRFEYNERHAGIGKVRLTCTVHIATGIIDELRVRAAAAEARHDSETLVACAEAVAAIFKAMEDERDRPAGPASHTRPAPN